MPQQFALFISRDIEKFHIVEAASLDAAKHVGHAWLQRDRNRALFLRQRLEEREQWTLDCTSPPAQFIEFGAAPEPPHGSFNLYMTTACCYPICVEADSYFSALVQGSAIFLSPEFRQYALDRDAVDSWEVYACGPTSVPPSRSHLVGWLRPLKRLVQRVTSYPCLAERREPEAGQDPKLREQADFLIAMIHQSASTADPRVEIRPVEAEEKQENPFVENAVSVEFTGPRGSRETCTTYSGDLRRDDDLGAYEIATHIKDCFGVPPF